MRDEEAERERERDMGRGGMIEVVRPSSMQGLPQRLARWSGRSQLLKY